MRGSSEHPGSQFLIVQIEQPACPADVTRLESLTEPAHALPGRAVGEGVGNHVAPGPFLEPVVADLAREVGVPPWKLKSMRAQARGWEPGGLARALTAVARADAEVKGAADDAEFALERAVLTISGSRRH